MLQLLSAAGTAISVVIGIAAAGIVVFAVVYHAVRKKQGKGGCDCGCSDCTACHMCSAAKREENKK